MIKKICLIVLAFTLPIYAQYSFEFTCLDDTVKYVNFNDAVDFYFRLHNTGSLQDIYEFDCIIIDSIPGWFVLYCIGGVCVEPGVITHDTLDAGEIDTSIVVHVYTADSAGTEVVNLRVASIGDPSLRDSINVYVTVQAGIEDYENNTIQSSIIQIYPNPFREKTEIRWQIADDRIQLKIYDVTGGLVKNFLLPTAYSLLPSVLWDACDDLGNTVPAGVYFVHLNAGDCKRIEKVVLLR
ncbi:MAG: T9SS type A sorting domain-containing protein [bacterium]